MSEITNIPLGGVSNEPNDYGSEDGALSLSLNAVKHYGSIRPVMPGSPVKDIGELPANTDVVAIHEVGDMKHYILLEEIEKEAGSRSLPDMSVTITVHYLCLPDKVRIWWSSNNPDKFAGPAEMLIGIGIEDARDYSEISVPYGEQREYDIPNLTIRYDETGDIGYEFYDRARHLTDELIVPKLVTYSGKDTPPDPAENLNINIKNEFIKPVIDITCVNMPEQVMLSCNITKIPEMPVHHVQVWMAGHKYNLKEGERIIVPADDITIDATVSPMLKYVYPDQVIEEGLMIAEKLYATSIMEYSDFMSSTGITDYYTVNYIFEGVEDSDGGGDDGGDNGDDNDGTNDGGGDDGNDNTEDEITDPVCRLLYVDAHSNDKTPIRIAEFAEHVTSVSTIGNVLTIILNDQPLFYIIWRDNKYQVLGSKLPELECGAYIDTRVLTAAGLANTLGITFDESKLTIYDSEKPELSGAILSSAENNVSYTSEMKNFAYNKVFSVVNSAHHAMAQQGYFYAPFYVRMAYRMFDGTHVMHTPPKLMMVNSAGHPFFQLKKVSGDDKVQMATLKPYFPCAKLNVDIAPIDNKWKELITDIDVFVTPPIINYSDSPESIVGTRSLTRDYALAQQNKDTMRSALDFVVDSDQSVVVSDIVAYKDVWYKIPANLLVADSAYVIAEHEYDFDIEDYSESKETWNKDTTITTNAEGKAVKLIDLALPSWLKGKLVRGDSVSAYKATNATKYEYNSVTAHVTYIGVFESVTFVPLFDFNEGRARSLVFQRADGTSYGDNLVEENRFLRIKSIPIAEIEEGWSGEIATRELALDTIEQHEVLSDNGQSRSTVIPSIKPLNYNTRLSIVADKFLLPETSKMEYFVSPAWKESPKEFLVLGDSTKAQFRRIVSAWVRGVVNSQTIYTKLKVGSAYADGLRQFYYPDYNATQLILLVANSSTESKYNFSVMVYNLKKHKLLNGAYLFDEFKVVQPSATKNYNTREDANKDADIKNAMSGKTGASYGNMVRVSNVANPFYFNEVNQVTLPTGTISGLSTTAKALSQGQFGAFPLYCFSDNGIWALEVSDTGTYSAKQPVSRAVCTNPESITQTEGSVLFVTKRGLMALDGSNVTCVSEILSGHNYTSALSKLDKVKELAGLKDVPNPDTHIEEWLQDARLLYDDKRQMIYAFNGENVLGYVYSISDQAWGMMVHDLDHPLPCYTDALAVTRENSSGVRRLVNMSDHTGCGDAPKAVLVTRPLVFGSADAYKSIEALTLRGMLDKDDAKLVVWASNDLKHWAVVASSQTSWYRGKSGTPYKYYRIGIVLEWQEEDSLSAIGADTTTRLTNRIR